MQNSAWSLLCHDHVLQMIRPQEFTLVNFKLLLSLIAQHEPTDAKIENICESFTYIMGSWGLPTCVFASIQAAMPLKQSRQPACLQIHMWAVTRRP